MRVNRFGRFGMLLHTVLVVQGVEPLDEVVDGLMVVVRRSQNRLEWNYAN